jgi:hypothetical protein
MGDTRYIPVSQRGSVSNLMGAVALYGLDMNSAPWYRRSHVEIAHMSNLALVPMPLGTVIVSLLSPSKKWEENVLDGHRFIAAAQSGGNPLDLPWSGISYTGPRQAFRAWEDYLERRYVRARRCAASAPTCCGPRPAPDG